MKRDRLAPWLLLTLAGSAPGCESRSPQDQPKASVNAPAIIELQSYVGRLVTVTGWLHGDSLRLLFDSGGGETILAPHVAEQISCTPAGRSVGVRMSGENVEWPLCHDVPLVLAGRMLVDATTGIWDIMAVLPEGLPRLDGLVSLETFRDQLVTLNLANSQLVLETAETLGQRVGTMSRVPMRIATGSDGSQLTVLLQGRIQGTESSVWLLLDSGNLGETLLAPHVRSDMAASDVAIIFGDSVVVTAPARIAEIIYDGALSEAFLRQVIISLDLRRGEAWIALSGKLNE